MPANELISLAVSFSYSDVCASPVALISQIGTLPRHANTRFKGDERPCQRCIKRGLQNQCHDGVRKKAKYLHDAPAEALMPGGRSHFSNSNGSRDSYYIGGTSMAERAMVLNQQAAYFNQQEPANHAIYQQNASQAQLSPPLQDSAQMNPFGTQSNVLFSHSGQQGTATSMPGLPPTFQTVPSSQDQQWFDMNDPALFNFDIDSLNFSNQFGALEFGMLGHMSSGAAESPEHSTFMGSVSGPPGSGNFSTSMTGSSAFADSPEIVSNMIYQPDSSLNEWSGYRSTGVRQLSANQVYNPQMPSLDSVGQVHWQQEPHAYAIGSGPGSLQSSSPCSNTQDFLSVYDQSPISPTLLLSSNQQQTNFTRPALKQRHSHQQQDQQYHQHQKPRQSQQQYPVKPTVPLNALQPVPTRKRRRDPSAIYSTVDAPYSYTTGFHNLTAYIQTHFPAAKTLRIAKALASIRPSFISCTKTLNNDDLVFMEKCFQRTLWEYEDFINFCGTPTIVCRRTGEIAAVGKEFSILTGWKKDVLLGREPNLNVNTGSSTSGNPTASSRGGFNTPRIPNAEGERRDEADENRPQPVYLAELLDQDSVVQFYEDFAKLAFGDSRGSVIAPCKLLKYKTKDDAGYTPDDLAAKRSMGTDAADVKGTKQEPPAQETFDDYQARQQQQQLQSPSASRKRDSKGQNSAGAAGRDKTVANISGEAGMNKLGEREGMVDCTYCWTVKRDVFDIPMLIVMNVSVIPSHCLSLRHALPPLPLTPALCPLIHPRCLTTVLWSLMAPL